jgi:hypothetical protein
MYYFFTAKTVVIVNLRSIVVILTSDPPLKETVLGVFDLAEIVAGGSKNKQIDGFCAKFFAKSIAKNRNRLAFVV